jgi:sulfite exporter TauE/SafE
MSAIHCMHEITVNNGLVISLFIAGLVGGATHCTWMCGPFILSQTSNKQDLSLSRASLLLPYHLGRATTYIFLALLINTALSATFIHNELRTLIVTPMILLAALFFLSSIYPSLSKIFPWLYTMKPLLPSKLVSSATSLLMKRDNIINHYLLGIVLGFLPCGLVFAALLASSTAPSTSKALISMAAFTLGTMPSLMLLSVGAKKITRTFPSIQATLKKCSMMLSSAFLIVIVITLMS